MKNPKLIQAALITISIVILLGLFAKMQTTQPQEVAYDPYSKTQYIGDIKPNILLLINITFIFYVQLSSFGAVYLAE